MLKSNLHTLLLLAVVGIGNWFAAALLPSKTSIGKEIEGSDDKWQLPNVSLSNSALLNKTRLENLHPWGKPEKKTDDSKETSEKAAEKPKYAWKLLGIVGEGKGKYALVINGANQKIEHYIAGAELPDGSRLLDVQANGVSVQEKEVSKAKNVQLHAPPS